MGETMKLVVDDTAIEAIVSMLMDLQGRDNVNLPLYEQQLREADTAIQNLLNAIQQGILTKSAKGDGAGKRGRLLPHAASVFSRGRPAGGAVPPPRRATGAKTFK